MENLKEELQFTIQMELHGLISLINQKKADVYKEDYIELGAFVGANFIKTAHKQEGQITKRELDAVYGNINDFFMESFKGQVTPEDLKNMMHKSLGILQHPNSDNQIQQYFQSITGS
jgi:hypothetical protein